ncbi:sensitivity to high expression protein she9 [Dipsacomyces acuminosporus]|nr:sensitivity to high expression protein she9 [Dipsacomyces acuminosporus]
MSGYDTIAGLKAKVEVAGEQFIKARLDLKEIERSHARTIQSRISSQREINSLLQRKHMWNEEDVARFTSLYRDEHQAEMSERQASKLLKDAEGLVDRQYDSLVNAIRERYHEEQTWSDKIRQLSTYSTWAILTMNILVLFITLAIFEPRKRRKIVDGVDEKLTLAITGQNAVIKQANDSVEQQLWQQQKTINDLAEHAVQVSTALASISAKQNTEMAALSTHLLNSTHAPDTSPDAANDTELDMYYQQASAKPQPSWWVPGSAIWRTLTHSNANTRATSTAIANQRNDGRRRQQQQQQQQEEEAFTKAEASQLAIEAAAVASLVTAALTYYFST